jgi:hypothetical protein
MRRAVTVFAALALGGRVALAGCITLAGCAVLAGSALVAPLSAQEAGSVEQVQLTPKDVENFLASYPAMQKLAQQFETRYGAPQSTDDDDPAGTFAGYLKNDKARAEVEALLKRYGFPNFEAWQRVTTSVVIAYGALGDEAAGAADQDVDKEIEAIRKDPKLTEEQKDARISELTEQLGALTSLRPLPGNVDVVRPFEARLKAVMESE